MKTIGIKLADGSFYPVLQENTVAEKKLDLTTAHNNQTTVMVDLYRSASCSMEDAEYVDSLQIDNLVAHPNGEADISFSVSIDENNKLSAKIVDTETGKQSKTTITLVSRTQEERLITDEYDISDSRENKVKKVAGLAAGGGLLAAASALREKEAKKDATEVEFTPAADMDFDLPAEAETEEPVIETEETPVPEVEETFEPAIEEPVVEETVIEEPVTDDIFAETAVNDIPEDFGIDETATDIFTEETTEPAEADETTETPAEEIEAPAEDDVFAPMNEPEMDVQEETVEFNDITDNTEETPAEFPQDMVDFGDETIASDELSDINFDFPGDDSEQVISEAASFDATDLPASDETVVEEDPFAIPDSSDAAENTDTFESTDTISEDSIDLDLPDFPEETNETPAEDDPFAIPDSSETIADTSLDLDLPDFQETSDETVAEENPFAIPDSSETISEDNMDLDLPDFPEDSNNTVTDSSLDLDLPDFADDSVFSDDFDSISEEPKTSYEAPAGGGISFTGLYDKETELGESSNYETEDVKKKTKVPVIICIICAIICILATVLVLLVIPSKYNLINKKADAKETVIEQPVEPVETVIPEPEEEPEPIPEPVPEAKEDEIIVIEKAEEVVPEQPPVAEEKPKDITYKIKWGDTLWDIADTYYKNPWRYKYIARFNKIKNPDHIISGTYITIPAE